MTKPPRPLAQRLPDPVELVLDLVQPLVVAASPLGGGDQQERVLLVDEVFDAGEQARLGRELGGIAQFSRGLRRRNAHRHGRRPCGRLVNGALRFTQLTVSNNLRLLVGMIRANRPARVMARLSRSATAALGTAPTP